MDAQTGEDSRHDNFRNTCMAYGDFNRQVFLEEILRFISSAITSKAELTAIRKAVLKRTKRLEKPGQRGRPRAWDNEEWIQKAITSAFRRHVLGWSWPKVTESIGMQPTKPNIRTVQRRELTFAELIFEAIPPVGCWDIGKFGEKLRETALDSKSTQMWISSKTGLPFDKQPEDCKKIVFALAPLGSKPANQSLMREIDQLARKKKK
jgi:hypothetical protein